MNNYNTKVEELLKECNGYYRTLNNFVMDHTYDICKSNDLLIKSIDYTNNNSYMVKEEDDVNVMKDSKTENIIVTGDRTIEAASKYKNKKVAILNFANNHSIGGAPWSSGAQEESLCRVSTLYPCLESFREPFYKYHSDLYHNGIIDNYGNNDLLYLPNITVFKTDESAPKLMDENDWFSIDVIASAAPMLYGYYDINRYKDTIYNRIKRILEIAKRENIEVLILGAYGCGAFNNPPEIVASTFKELLNEYHFDLVEFAVYCNNNYPTNNYHKFKNILLNE